MNEIIRIKKKKCVKCTKIVSLCSSNNVHRLFTFFALCWCRPLLRTLLVSSALYKIENDDNDDDDATEYRPCQWIIKCANAIFCVCDAMHACMYA